MSSLNDQIILDVVTNVNTENLEKLISHLGEAKAEASQLKQSMAGMDAPAKALNEQVDTFMTSTDYLVNNAKKLQRSVSEGVMSDEEVGSAVKELQRGFDDIKTFKNLISSGGSFSVGFARQMLQDLPSEVQKEFNQITPKVMAAIRRGMNPLLNGKSSKITARNLDGMVTDAMGLEGMSQILGQATHASDAQKRTLLKALIPTAGLIHRTAEYQTKRYGGLLPQEEMPSKVEDFLPEFFKGSYSGKGFSKRIKGSTTDGKRVLSAAGMDALAQIISSNPVAARAIEISGLATRDAGGTLTLGGNVTKSKLNNNFASALWNEFYTRTRGLKDKLPEYFETDYSLLPPEMARAAKNRNDEIQRKIVSRGFSGTGGTTSVAMRQLSDLMLNPEYWQSSPTEDSVTGRRIKNEEKRLKEQYVVQKIDPFTKTRKNVTLAESQATRMLGLQGHNYEDTDLIKLIDLGNYDANNQEQKKIVNDLLTKGLTEGGKSYSVHAIHGTGNNTMLRMIENGARKRVSDRYAPLAKALGLDGTDVWNSFVRQDFDFGSPDKLGKHMEQLNKMWTDSYVLGSGLQGKNFAFVDFSRLGENFSDGIGYVLEEALPSAIQARFAISGKGSLAPIHASSMLEWGEKAGLAKNGKVILPGFDGSMVDVTNATGLIDRSLIKNLPAFQGMSNEQANAALTGLMELFPISAAADYSYDGAANGLGSQMMSFMSLSPEIMLHQSKALTNRLRELDTNEGKRKYVFNKPNSSYVSQMVNDPVNGDRFLNTNTQALREVENYRRALISDVAAGEWLDFSDGTGSVSNARLVRNPIMAILSATGALSNKDLADFRDISSLIDGQEINKETLASQINYSALEKATNILESAHNRTFSKDEVLKYLSLEGGLLDFENEDQALIGAIRSPTGFGQYAVRENYAKILRPLFEAYGMDMSGLYLNDADLKTLAGADFDGDEVKRILGTKYNIGKGMSIDDYISTLDSIKKGDFVSGYKGPDLIDEVRKTIKQYEDLNITEQERAIKTEDLPSLPGGNLLTNVANWERTIELSRDATNKMGYYSAVGTRLSQLDLADAAMRAFAVQADKGNEGYDPATTLPKKPKKILEDKALFQAINLGQEYAKIPAHLTDMFNVEAIRDEDGNVIRYMKKDSNEEIDPSDVYKTKNGELVDLRFLKGYDDSDKGFKLDKTNLPSRYSDSIVAGLIKLKDSYDSFKIDDSMSESLTEIFTKAIGYGDAGENTRKLMENRRKILAETVGQTRFGITDDEAYVLSTQYAAAMKEIDDDVRKREEMFGQAGHVRLDDGSNMESWKYRNQQISKYGLNQAALMLGLYRARINGQEVQLDTGLIRSKLAEKYGEDFAEKMFGGMDYSLANPEASQVADGYQKYVINKPDSRPNPESVIQNAQLSQEVSDRTKLAKIKRDIEAEKIKLLEAQDDDLPFYDSAALESDRLKELQAQRAELEQKLGFNFGSEGSSTFDYDAFSKAVSDGQIDTARTLLKGQQLTAAGDEFRRRINERMRGYNKEIYKNENATQADQWYGINDYYFKNDNETFAELEAHLTDEEKAGEYWRELRNELGLKNDKYYAGRRAHVDNAMQGFQTTLNEAVDGKGSEADKLVSRKEFYNQQILEAESELDNALKSVANNASPTEAGKKADASVLERAKLTLEEMIKKRDEGLQKILEESAEMFQETGEAFDEMLQGKQKAKSPYKQIDKAVKKAKQIADEKLADIDERFEKDVLSEEDYIQQREEWEARAKEVNSGKYRQTLEKEVQKDREKELHSLEKKIAGVSGIYDKRRADIDDVYRKAEEAHDRNIEEMKDNNLSPEERDRSQAEAERYIELATTYEEKVNAKSQEELSKQINETSRLAGAKKKTPEEIIQDKVKAAQDRALHDMGLLNEAADAGVYAQNPEEFTKRMQQLTEAYNKAESEYKPQLEAELKSQRELADKARSNQEDALERSRKLNLELDQLNFERQDQTKQQLRYAFRGNIARGLFNLQDRKEALNLKQKQQRNRLLDLQNDKDLKDKALRDYIAQNGGDESKLEDDEEYKKRKHDAKMAEQQVTNLNNQIKQTDTQIDSLTKPSDKLGSVFKSVGVAALQLGTRLGKQLWQKGIQEAKRFIKEYDQSMTEVQMITLKSDAQIDTLGSTLINKAKDLKVSVGDVAKSATALYRQGLSDSEVNDRLDTIMKFSKVSGTNVGAATKLATVATNTGLVKDVSEAADIVTALGDNAATNAAEIEKGIEKAGAAAAVDGTTFGELSAMLTAITSTTQIGGNVAGRTLNTIMARMNKIGTNELIYDENGNAVSGSNVAKLLQAQGVQLYDQSGNKRSTFDVLKDLSQNWDSISDAEKNQLSTEIAGTRMYSNFAAIMQGMQEGKIDEYMDLVNNSEGIVDQKYAAYEDSLEASKVNLQTGFDHFVKNYFGWTADVSKTFNGIFGDMFNGLGGLIDSDSVRRAKRIEDRESTYQSILNEKYSGVDRLETLSKKNNRTNEEEEEYNSLIQTLGKRFGVEIGESIDIDTSALESTFENISSGADDAAAGLESVASAMKNVGKDADEAAQKILEEAKRQKEGDLQNYLAGANADIIEKIKEDNTTAQAQAERKSGFFSPIFQNVGSFNSDGMYSFNGSDSAARLLKLNYDSARRGNGLIGKKGIDRSEYNAVEDVDPWLSIVLAMIAKDAAENTGFGSKYNGLATLRQLTGLGSMLQPGQSYDQFISQDYWKEHLRTSGMSEDMARIILNWYKDHPELGGSYNANQNPYIDIFKQQMSTSAFKNVYADKDIDYLAEEMAKGVRNGTQAQHVWDDWWNPASENYKKKAEEALAKRDAEEGDAAIFKEMGLKDVGSSGYYVNNEGQRYSREALLGMYRDNLKRSRGEVLGSKVIYPFLSKEDQDELEHLRSGTPPYEKLLPEHKALVDRVAQTGDWSDYRAIGTSINNAAFEETNKVGIAADALINIMREGNITDADSFMKFVESRQFGSWNDIQPTLANVMTQARYNADKKRWEGPENFTSQILDQLYGSSLSYGKRQRTSAETAALAQEALLGLQNNSLFLTSQEQANALTAAQNQITVNGESYQEALRKYQTKNKAATEADFIQDNLSTKDAAKLNAITQKGVLSASQAEALQGIIGARLYQRAIEGEQFEGAELDYINKRLSMASAGRTDYTNRERLANIATIRSLATQGALGTVDEDIQKDYLKGFSNADRWLELSRKQTRTEEEESELQDLNNQLDLLQRNTRIEIEIEGLQTLEQAGKLLDGIAASIEKLRKGGKIALDEIANIGNSAYQRGQYEAMLSSEDYAERTAAIKYFSGWDDDRISADRAGAEEAAYQGLNAEQDRLQATADALSDKWFEEPSSEEGEVYKQAGLAMGFEWDESTNRFLIPEEIPEQNRANLFAGTKRRYNALDIANAQQAMLDKTLSDTTGDYNLYTAAAAQVGENTSNYLKALAEGADENSAEMVELKKKAQAEVDKSKKEAEDSQRLQDLDLAGSAYAYAREQYQQNNKAGLAANSLYTAITPDNVKNWSDFANIIGTDQKENWDELIKSAPELTKQFEDAGLVFDEAGNFDIDATIEAIRANGGDLAKALATVASLIGDKSIDFKDRNYETRGETIANASGFETWDSATILTDQQLLAARQIYGDALVAKRRDPNHPWSEEDTAEANQRYSNYLFGGNGLSEYQRLSGLQQLQQKVDDGSLMEFLRKGGYEQYSEWTSGFENADQYFGIAQRLNAYNAEHGTSLTTSGLKELEGADLEHATEALGDYVGGVKAAAKVVEDFNQEVTTKTNKALNSFGDYTDEATSSLINLSKGGKAALKELSSLRSKALTSQDMITATQKARGKSGKNVDKQTKEMIAGYLGVDTKDIDKYTKDELDSVLDNIQDAVNEEFTESNFKPVLQAALDTLNKNMEPQELHNAVKIITDVNGDMDVGQVAALVEQYDQTLAAAIRAYEGVIAEYHARVTATSDGKGNGDVLALGTVSANLKGAGAGGGYNKGGGGGGGGGKSAVDKLLEAQKHKVAEAQHNIKMLDIQEKYYDRTNDYETYIDFLDEEVAAQEKLQALYKSNLKEMNDMLGSVEEGTDDWYKLKEAIFSAEEAMADINNTIAEINAKQIAIRTEQFENEDKPRTHKTTMLETLASRYMSAKEYDNYNKTMQTQIEATREQISENNKQIATWEGMLTSYEENSDQWIEVRDKIWALREENASLENQALDSIIELNNQKVSQIAEELQHNQAFDNHAINMYSTYGQMYQTNRQYTDYRNTLTESNVSQGNLITSYQGSIDELRDLMSTLDMTSDAWYSARDSIFQYEEAIAQARASIQENNAAIQQSVVEELTTGYDQMMSDIDHEIKVLQNQKQIYDNANDFDAYIEMMKKEKNATQDMVSTMRDGLAEMEYQIGTIDEDSEAWWNLHDKILSVREAISDAEVNLENFDREIEQSKLDHLIEKFGKIDEIDTHNLKMIQYAETFYQNRGELTNYGTMLSAENEYQQRYADDLRDHIRLLEEERENVEVGSDAYYKLEQQIMKYEEQLEQTNNSIDKNNKLLEQNAEKIRQTVMTVENYVDKEIRARIQKSRDMLAAEVSMQNTILDTIKTRYKQEWDRRLGPYQSNCWNTLKPKSYNIA